MAGPIARWAGAEQPAITDGVRGEGLPIYSVFGPDRDFVGVRVQTWRGYSSLIQLIITVPGREPYRLDALRWMTYDKFPIAGVALPLTVSRSDPSAVRIEWDEVPDVNELIRTNAPIVSDPDRVEAGLREAKKRAVATAIDNTDAQLDEYARAYSQSLAPGQFAAIVRGLRGEADADPGAGPARLPANQPSARVLAHTYPRATDDDGASAIRVGGSRMLLSVHEPGRPRYGYLWRGIMHTSRFFSNWCDIPVTIKRNGDIRIEWHQMETTTDYALSRLERAGAETKAALDALTTPQPSQEMQKLIEMAVPESKRAEVEAQLAQASAENWANPLAAPTPPNDPAALLQQLADLHAAGAITDDEYDLERRRVLDQI
jgi:hypothetical protein